MKFQELSLSPVLQENLSRHGFKTPTAIQEQAIPAALAGTDVVATAQTGTGKTLAFVLPALNMLLNSPTVKGVRVVIMSPTRELAIQINETFHKLAETTGIRAAVVVGGLSENTQLNAIRRGAQVLIATPGRLSDFVERRLVRLESVELAVLDEADRMLDMGFLPTINNLLNAIGPDRQTLFFSATMEKSVAHLVSKYLKDPIKIAIGSITRPVEDIDLRLYEVDQDRKLGLLEHLMVEEPGTFLVFARTKHGADKLLKKLKRDGVKAAVIHGDRSQAQRNQALAGFQNGQYRVLVATDVAARGIHVDGIAHVVNVDLPAVAEDFIHRAGRTGRAGMSGVASIFATRQQRGDITKLERALKLKLKPSVVPASVQREEKSLITAPVVVIDHRNDRRTERPSGPPNQFRPRRRSFASGR